MSQKTILTAAVFSVLCSGTALAFEIHASPLNKAARSPHILHVNAAEKADTASEAHGFVKALTDRGIGFLSNDALTEADRKKEFRKLLKDSFDMKTIGRFALGRYWKDCTETQRAEYLKLFEEMIVEVYSRRFSDYNGQQLVVTEARKDGEVDSIVSSSIIPSEGPEIKVDWRVRDKNGKMQVVDIVVEGVSMSLTQRADFASVIQRGGGKVDTLLEHLRPH